MAEPRNHYSAVSLVLHWLIAVLAVGQVLLISAHDATHGQPISRTFVMIHMSSGLLILVLTLARIGWRMANPAIRLPGGMPRWQKLLARTTHVLFYVVLLALPLLGWASVSARGRDILWFGLFQWPSLPLPHDRALAGALMDWHQAGVKVLYVLIVLHVLGALKHHFIDRDNVLHRMIPMIPRRP